MIGLCKELVTLRQAGRLQDLAAHFTEDCEMRVPGVSGLSPFAGHFFGRDACIRALQAHVTLVEVLYLQPLGFLVENDCLIVQWTSSVRNRGTGAPIPVSGVARLRFRGRQVSFYSNHFDTAAVAAVT